MVGASDAVLSSLWRQVRVLRHDPPARAREGERRQVFTASLEQSEQLFEASTLIDAAARPLTLFYGLSQAGRALSAALADDEWKLKGHGIRARSIEQGLLAVQVQDNGRGSFTQLASVLDSPSIPSEVPLHAAWATLPEAREHPLPCPNDIPVLRLWPEHLDWTVRSRVANGYLCGLPSSVAQSSNPKAAVADFLKNYPSAEGWEISVAEDVPLRITQDRNWGWCVHLRWMTAESDRSDRDRLNRLRNAAVRYRDDDALWVPPAVASNDRPLHPLLVWWAVLYGVSMLARYEPARWIEHLDVDQSSLAVPIEAVLNEALEACPDLIRLALADAS